MADSQLYSIQGKENSVIRQIIKIDVTTTTVVNTSFSDSITFGRAYSAIPTVLGSNAPRPGAIVNVVPSTTGLSVHVRGLSDAPLADGTLVVTATIEGRLA